MNTIVATCWGAGILIFFLIILEYYIYIYEIYDILIFNININRMVPDLIHFSRIQRRVLLVGTPSRETRRPFGTMALLAASSSVSTIFHVCAGSTLKRRRLAKP